MNKKNDQDPQNVAFVPSVACIRNTNLALRFGLMYSNCLLDRLGAKYDGDLDEGAQPCHFHPLRVPLCYKSAFGVIHC